MPDRRNQIWDGAAGGGSFRLNGAVLAAGKVIDVMAGQLAALEFVTGNAGTEQLSLRAFDGYGWTGWKPFELTTLA